MCDSATGLSERVVILAAMLVGSRRWVGRRSCRIALRVFAVLSPLEGVRGEQVVRFRFWATVSIEESFQSDRDSPFGVVEY